MLANTHNSFYGILFVLLKVYVSIKWLYEIAVKESNHFSMLNERHLVTSGAIKDREAEVKLRSKANKKKDSTAKYWEKGEEIFCRLFNRQFRHIFVAHLRLLLL